MNQTERKGPPRGILETDYLKMLRDIADEHEEQLAEQIADRLRQCGIPTGLAILAAVGMFLKENL